MSETSDSSNTNNDQKKEWKDQLLDMEEVLNETPMFRERMRIVEQDIDDLGIRLKKLVKMCRESQRAATVLNEVNKEFGDELQDFAKCLRNKENQKGIEKFAQAIKESENFRDMLNLQLENVIAIPMESFAKDEIEEVKEKKKKYTRASVAYENALGKASQVKKQLTMKTLEVEHELSDARKEFHRSGLDFVFQLNEVEAKKQFEILERVTALMYSNMAYFHQGYELFNELSPIMKQLSVEVQEIRKTFETDKKEISFYKKVLQQKVQMGGIEPRVDAATATTIQGYLWKLSTSIRKDWKRRYFVVENGIMRYYHSGKDLNPVTAINLLLCTVKVKNDIDRRYCFEIISPDKSYVLQADNEEKMNEWITVLHNVTANLLNNQQIASKKSSYTASPSEYRKSVPAVNAVEPLTQLRASNEQNNFCADCGSKDPEWAVINLGILICIECSGIHRSMGVHISKVRSFTLDKCDPDLLRMMLAIGNETANQIFEAEIPAVVTKPTPTADRTTRERFIRLKYEKKSFVEKSLATPEELGKGLYNATKQNNLFDLLQYLAQGADINYQIREEKNKSSTHAAVIEGNISALILLVQNRADVSIPDIQLWTPLHYAAHLGRTNCVAVLFRSGAKIDAKDITGQTPLELAIAGQKADCVTYLRLAQLALSESAAMDDSFMEALQNFTIDTQNQENI